MSNTARFVLKYKKAVLGSLPLVLGLAALWGFSDPSLELKIGAILTDVFAIATVVAATNE